MASKLRSIQRAREQETAKAAVLQVTLEDLLRSRQALQSLASMPLPARDAFRLCKIVKAVAKELEACNDTRLKLCEQFGKLNEDTQSYDFASDSDREAFTREYGELLKTEVEISGERINPSILNNISAGELLVLAWLIED